MVEEDKISSSPRAASNVPSCPTHYDVQIEEGASLFLSRHFERYGSSVTALVVTRTDYCILVLEQAATINIVHRDCSLNNSMIEDLEDGTSRGLLLDWEFGVEVNKEHKYNVGGTVSQSNV